MAVQLNLLPDVKTNYIKTQKAKRTVVLASVIVSGVAIGIVLLLAAVVYGGQAVQLNNLKKDIATKSDQLKNVENLDKILTIQNQLNALPALHSSKPVMSRLFVFLPQVTPSDVQIADFSLDFQTSSMSLTGTAKDLVAVNRFVDTLKFTKYTTDQSTDEKVAFTEVVLTGFTRSDKDAKYSISLKFDPALFSSEYKTVTLVVPKITSTRADVNSPLFKALPKETN